MKREYIWGMTAAGILVIVIAMAVFGNKPGKGKDKPLRVNAAAAPSISEADKQYQKGDYIKARDLYKAALEDLRDLNALSSVQKKVEDLNMKILFSPMVDEYSTKYTVKPYDSLYKIARKFHTTPEFIQRANLLKTTNIIPGQELKIPTAVFSVVVDKSQNTLFLKVGNEVFKTYVVSTGKDNSTPVGKFKITANKLKNPTWYKTGTVVPPNSPENILGTRWMGIDVKGYGIHGTTQPEQLGMQVTAGCIRMRNDEVEELYDIVPVGTEVTIVD